MFRGTFFGHQSALQKEYPHSVAAPLEPVPSEAEGGAPPPRGESAAGRSGVPRRRPHPVHVIPSIARDNFAWTVCRRLFRSLVPTGYAGMKYSMLSTPSRHPEHREGQVHMDGFCQPIPLRLPSIARVRFTWTTQCPPRRHRHPNSCASRCTGAREGQADMGDLRDGVKRRMAGCPSFIGMTGRLGVGIAFRLRTTSSARPAASLGMTVNALQC